MSDADIFSRLYVDPLAGWGGHSGGGSDATAVIDYRSFLERFVRMNAIGSVVDIGCGDWQFSRFIDWGGARYHGFDVVEPVIARNRAAHARDGVAFDVMPSDLGDLPDADLLIMKDVLQHLPDADIMRFRDRLFGRYRTCLLTNSYRKVDTATNVDIETGGFRCLDLTAPPYSIDGVYVLEFGSALWERLRTLLVRR